MVGILSGNFLFNATLCAIRTVSEDPQLWPRLACSPAANQPSIHVSLCHCISGIPESDRRRQWNGHRRQDPKLSLDESSSLRSFLGIKKTEILSARRVEERPGLRWWLTPICCPPPNDSRCSRCSLVTCQSSVKHLSTSQGDSKTDSFLCLVGSGIATATLAQALAVAQVFCRSELHPPLFHEAFYFNTHRHRSCKFGH